MSQKASEPPNERKRLYSEYVFIGLSRPSPVCDAYIDCVSPHFHGSHASVKKLARKTFWSSAVALALGLRSATC